MEAIIVFIIFIFIGLVVNGVRGGAKGSRKRQEAVEEQRRRRAAYEAEHGKMTPTHQQKRVPHDYHQEHPYVPVEENRPMAGAPIEEKRPKSVLGHQQSSSSQYPLYQQEHKEDQPAETVGAIPERYRNPVASSVSAPPIAQSNMLIRRPVSIESALQPVTGQWVNSIDELRRGIVMAEILGPCRAKSGPVFRRIR